MSASGSWKYLYERLGDARFQQMCGALLNLEHRNVQVFPVGQADGGRDMVVPDGKGRGVVYQVKFTSDRKKPAIKWFVDAIRGEDAKIRELVKRGYTSYVLMTNVEGTSALDKGSRDKLERELDRLSKDYGIPMSCLWSSDIDARVDGSVAVRQQYFEMLTGVDGLAALLGAPDPREQERRERELILDYLHYCWALDRAVKFKQVEFKSDQLANLFVDVSGVGGAPDLLRAVPGKQPLPRMNAMAGHLLDARCSPTVLIQAVPGQGKSTVVQYVCQAHRASLLGRDELQQDSEAVPEDVPAVGRVPFRIDLAAYAKWVEGGDPFAHDDQAPKRKRRRRCDVELFLVEHVADAMPGRQVTEELINGWLERYPTLVACDGLDEVALPVRGQVVELIEKFATRWASGRKTDRRTDPKVVRCQVIVTTRPNDSQLPEPNKSFERWVLQPLTESSKRQYLGKWMSAQHLGQADKQELASSFDRHIGTPHVAQLAENPMQLTILLDLMRVRGHSLPEDRTQLYRLYMELFLDREADKSVLVRDHRDGLKEATSFVAWYLQALSEIDADSSSLPKDRIVGQMAGYLAKVGRGSESEVKVLFEAMRDRFWVLTSKREGTYEFDVQSIREFFTAWFLTDYADAARPSSYDPVDVLLEMLPQGYWLNTARFLAGHIAVRANNLSNMADLISERVGCPVGARQVRAAVWSLFSDGVFTARQAPRKRIAWLLTDDLTVRFQSRDSTWAIPRPDVGGEDLAEALREQITADVAAELSAERSRLAMQVGERTTHIQWWLERLTQAGNVDTQQAEWLAIGAPFVGGLDLPPALITDLRLSSPHAARAAIAAGVSPQEGTQQADALTQWVLDGHCSDVWPEGSSEAADLLRVAAPVMLITLAVGDDLSRNVTRELGRLGHRTNVTEQKRRQDALRRLRECRSGCDLQATLRQGKGQKGTTSQWVNTARNLKTMYGQATWLATEVAAIGAGLMQARTGGDVTPDAPVWGLEMDYGQWVSAIRQHKASADWWREQLRECGDDFSRSTWVLGLVTVATGSVVHQMWQELNQVVEALQEHCLEALLMTCSRLSLAGLLCRRNEGFPQHDKTQTATLLLWAYGATDPTSVMGQDLEVLQEASRWGVASWPARKAVEDLFLGGGTSTEVVDALAAFGGPMTASSEWPERMPHLDETTARRILGKADRLATPWLILADSSLRDAHQQPPLKNVVETRWGI